MCRSTRYFSLLLTAAFLLRFSFALRAQGNGDRGGVYGLDRWAFRVNALELLCTVPNAGVEFDLSSSPYNRLSLGISAKYNWNTYHSLAPKCVFNMFEVRPELRYWYNPKKKDDSSEGNEQLAKKKSRQFTYFTGGYISSGSYSIKPGTYGIQGPLFSLGAIWGFDFPMYSYRHFALDFELGLAAGLALTKYDVFTMNRSGSDYVIVPEKSKGMHLCPFPVLTEVKACFVFRTLSIKDKYKKVDAQKMIQKQEQAEQRRIQAEQKAQERAQLKEQKAQDRAARKAQRAEQQELKKEQRGQTAAKRRAE